MQFPLNWPTQRGARNRKKARRCQVPTLGGRFQQLRDKYPLEKDPRKMARNSCHIQTHTDPGLPGRTLLTGWHIVLSPVSWTQATGAQVLQPKDCATAFTPCLIHDSLFMCNRKSIQSGFLKRKHLALAGVAQWIEYQPANQKVPGSIPSQLSQGTCLGCGPGPQYRGTPEETTY